MLTIFLVFLLPLILFSLRFNWWRPVQTGVPVLMYHNISENPVNDHENRKLTVSVDQFRRQLGLLSDLGRASVTFRESMTDRAAPAKPVIITLDDGYQDAITHAGGLLPQYGFRAVVFIPAGLIGCRQDYRQYGLRFPVIDRAQLLTWCGQGHEAGSHGMYHNNFTELSIAEKIAELSDSKRILEDLLQQAVVSFSFPYGRFSDDDVKLAADCGYRFICGIRRRLAGHDLRNPIPRVFVRGDDTMLDFNLSLTRGTSRL